jgi:hypothetical protein
MGVGGQRHAPVAFPPGKIPSNGYHLNISTINTQVLNFGRCTKAGTAWFDLFFWKTKGLLTG